MSEMCSARGRDHKCSENIYLKTLREDANWKREAYRILLQRVISRMDCT